MQGRCGLQEMDIPWGFVIIGGRKSNVFQGIRNENGTLFYKFIHWRCIGRTLCAATVYQNSILHTMDCSSILPIFPTHFSRLHQQSRSHGIPPILPLILKMPSSARIHDLCPLSTHPLHCTPLYFELILPLQVPLMSIHLTLSQAMSYFTKNSPIYSKSPFNAYNDGMVYCFEAKEDEGCVSRVTHSIVRNAVH